MTTTTTTSFSGLASSFEVNVSNDTFKFHAAHFVAFPGFRERLHGHTYRVGVKLIGSNQLRADGYLIDFGCVKDVTKAVCKRLNEHFLCPIYSKVLVIKQETTSDSIHIECTDDGAQFTFPRSDCAMLPLMHSTAEEIAIYLWAEILGQLDSGYLHQRSIHTMQVSVTEAPGQSANFSLEIPKTTTSSTESFSLDVRQFIVEGEIVPAPCQTSVAKNAEAAAPAAATAATAATTATAAACCPNCSMSHSTKLESNQLNRLVQAINDKKLQAPESGGKLTVEDLQEFL